MKRWLAIVGFCVFLVPCAYGETFNYDNGDKYVGDVVNGLPHGQGTYTRSNGDKYVGEWKDGLPDGHGTETSSDGREYVGEFKDGKKHGQGIYAFPDGYQYIGELRDGKPWEGIECPGPDFVNPYGTVSNGQWCRGCVPTEQQLATVDEVKQSLRSFLTTVNVEIALCDVNDRVLRGLSLDHPIVIDAETPYVGIQLEYAYLRNRFGNYDLILQSLIFKEGRPIDVMEIEAAGNLIKIYFDISNYY